MGRRILARVWQFMVRVRLFLFGDIPWSRIIIGAAIGIAAFTMIDEVPWWRSILAAVLFSLSRDAWTGRV